MVAVMLRSKSLVPLSHQHQHTLALCVRLERALQSGPVDLRAWQQEIKDQYEQELRCHFATEEHLLYPAANHFPELDSLIEELRDEHQRLRELVERARQCEMNQSELGEFQKLLSGHIRKEERKLFEALQRLMRPEDMHALGERLERELDKGG